MTFVQRTKADQSISMNCAVIFVENLQNISVCAKSIGAANAEVCRAGQSREARLLTVPRVAKISPLGIVSFIRRSSGLDDVAKSESAEIEFSQWQFWNDRFWRKADVRQDAEFS
jgi:hypothetical protein